MPVNVFKPLGERPALRRSSSSSFSRDSAFLGFSCGFFPVSDSGASWRSPVPSPSPDGLGSDDFFAGAESAFGCSGSFPVCRQAAYSAGNSELWVLLLLLPGTIRQRGCLRLAYGWLLDVARAGELLLIWLWGLRLPLRRLRLLFLLRLRLLLL